MSFISKLFQAVNPIKEISDVADKWITTPQEKREFEAAVKEKLQSLDMEAFKAEVMDRESARNREVELAKTGKKDWLMGVVGISVLISMLIVVWVALFVEIKDKNLFYFLAGNVFSASMALVGYYFGSSKGSKEKQDYINLNRK